MAGSVATFAIKDLAVKRAIAALDAKGDGVAADLAAISRKVSELRTKVGSLSATSTSSSSSGGGGSASPDSSASAIAELQRTFIAFQTEFSQTIAGFSTTLQNAIADVQAARASAIADVQAAAADMGADTFDMDVVDLGGAVKSAVMTCRVANNGFAYFNGYWVQKEYAASGSVFNVARVRFPSGKNYSFFDPPVFGTTLQKGAMHFYSWGDNDDRSEIVFRCHAFDGETISANVTCYYSAVGLLRKTDT